MIGLAGLIFAACLMTAPLGAEPRRFETISINEGLAQNSIYAVLQREDGRLWIGTADGLSVFDGAGFEQINRRREGLDGLRDNYISALLDLGEYGVLVGTLGGGMSLLDPVSHSGPNWKKGTGGAQLAHDDVASLDHGPEGQVLVAGPGGLALFNPESGQIRLPHDLSPGLRIAAAQPLRLARQLSDGRILLAFAEGSGAIHDPKQDITTALVLPDPAISIQTVAEGPGGRIWLGTDRLGVLTEGADGSFVPLKPAGGMALPEDIMSLLCDTEGRIWIATWTDGLFRYDPATERLVNFRKGGLHSLSTNALQHLFLDRTGSLWIGTFDAGLARTGLGRDAFTAYFPDPAGIRGPVNATVWTLADDGADGLWVGTREGLARLDRRTNRFTAETLPGGITDVRALLPLPEGLLVATLRHGLLLRTADGSYRPAFQSDPFEDFASVRHRLLMQDREGQIWLGTQSGLFLFDRNLQPLARFGTESLPHERIRALYQAADGVIWVGTSGGLSRWLPGENRFLTMGQASNLLPDSDVRAIWSDGERLFVGTGGGLAVIDIAAETTRFVLREHGLPNETFYSLVPETAPGPAGDKVQALWAGSNNGLIRIDTESLAIEVFHTRDGLPMAEFNFNAWAKLADGAIAMGGIGGLATFDPAAIHDNQLPPILSVTRSSLAPEMQLNAPATVTLDVASIHYAEPGSNRLHWQLSGGEWQISTGTRHALVLPDLGWGEYELTLIGESSGEIRALPQTVRFHIGPPVWAQPGFVLLGFASLAIAVFAGATLMRARAGRHAQRLERDIRERTEALWQAKELAEISRREAVENALDRNQFFAAMSHELKTPLTVAFSALERLKSRTSLARIDTTLLDVAHKAIGRLATLSDEMARAVRAPRSDLRGRVVADLESIVVALFDTYAAQGEDRGLTVLREGDSDLGIALVNLASVDRVVSNLLSNAMRHTWAGSRVAFYAGWPEEGWLRFSTSTGGPPIPPATLAAAMGFLRGEETRSAMRGLEIICDTVHRSGGRLEVSPDGLRITVDLPAIRDAALEAEEATDMPPQANAAPEPSANPVAGPDCGTPVWMAGKRVLIVEDNREIAAVLATEITAMGLIATSRRTLNQARLVLEQEAVDLVLCDIQLPGASGLDLGRWLRRDGILEHIPLIYVTATDIQGVRGSIDEILAEAVIRKPFAASDLRRQVAAVLRTAHSAASHATAAALQQSGMAVAMPDAPAGQGASDQRIRAELAAMLTDEIGTASIERLAGRTNTSRRSLERRLPQIFGSPFGQILTRRRVELTQKALLQGETLTVIATRLGIADASSLSRLFRQECGIPPSVWLARAREQAEAEPKA